MTLRHVVAALLALAAPLAAAPDEGMWTFNDFPVGKVEARYGFRADARWLEHVRLSSARLAQGCSGSFVSASGLVLTNHHCARRCIQELSTPQRDLVSAGFYAKAPADEARCPDLVSFLRVYATPFDLVTTNDIIGGNSGSPLVDREARIVGLVFDGNVHSLGGDYGFDPALNRAISVHSAGILEALAKIYGAQRIVQELRPAQGSGGD